jgi:hypothetical protein
MWPLLSVIGATVLTAGAFHYVQCDRAVSPPAEPSEEAQATRQR